MMNANLQEGRTWSLIRRFVDKLTGRLRGQVREKRGSVTVQLCLILSAILFLVATFADLSFAVASRPYAQEIMDLAGRSVLSEYDKDLKDRYGLFFFQEEKEEVKELFTKYLGESLKKSKGKTDLLALQISEATMDITDYSATNCDILMDQIVALMKYQVFTGSHNILDLVGIGRSSGEHQTPASQAPEAADLTAQAPEAADSTTQAQKRKLRNGRIINELPSRLLEGVDEGVMSSLNLPAGRNFGRVAYEEVCLNKYIVNNFNHKLKYQDPSFFSGEIEYILCGHLSDDANSNVVYLSLLGFRSAMNALHIKQDNTKMDLVKAAALVIGEGVATPAVEAGLIALWAAAEGALDVNHLEDGGRVALIKNNDQWRLSLDSVLASQDFDFAGGISEDQNEEGLDYEDYLFLFLCFKSRDSKLIRIMDLIHINIKGHYNKDFSYSSCSAGFAYNLELKRERPFLTALFLKKGQFTGSHEY